MICRPPDSDTAEQGHRSGDPDQGATVSGLDTELEPSTLMADVLAKRLNGHPIKSSWETPGGKHARHWGGPAEAGGTPSDFHAGGHVGRQPLSRLSVLPHCFLCSLQSSPHFATPPCFMSITENPQVLLKKRFPPAEDSFCYADEHTGPGVLLTLGLSDTFSSLTRPPCRRKGLRGSNPCRCRAKWLLWPWLPTLSGLLAAHRQGRERRRPAQVHKLNVTCR